MAGDDCGVVGAVALAGPVVAERKSATARAGKVILGEASEEVRFDIAKVMAATDEAVAAAVEPVVVVGAGVEIGVDTGAAVGVVDAEDGVGSALSKIKEPPI